MFKTPETPLEPAFIKSVTLMFFLLNPFFMSIYMIELYHRLDRKTFTAVLIRGATIATVVFIAFAVAGDRIFTDLVQARFSSFLVFGGIIFFIIGVRFVFQGEDCITAWRGKPEHIAGSIAMPFMIGPGTVSAAVLTGTRLPVPQAVLAIIVALASATVTIVLLKWIFDIVKRHNERLIQRYVTIVGRVMALVIGTFAVEMIFQGIEIWLKTL